MTDQRRVRRDGDIETDGTLTLGLALLGSSSPIETMEALGQRRLVSSTQLPIDGTEGDDAAAWAAMGVKLGEKTDDLFRHVELPEGWRLVATDHSMWSDLQDDRGRRRAGVFYKAAFYDRRARVSLERRYSVQCDWTNPDPRRHRVIEATRDGERVLFTSSAASIEDLPWEQRAEIETGQKTECEDWLKREIGPAWDDLVAAWNLP